MRSFITLNYDIRDKSKYLKRLNHFIKMYKAEWKICMHSGIQNAMDARKPKIGS